VSLVVDFPALTGRVLDGPELSAAAIRTYLCDAGVSRVVTDGGSKVLDYGRTQRTAPQPLFYALAVRDGGCRFGGCDRPVSWCHAHHIWEWEDGGPTKPANMVLLCGRHHHMVHRHRWTVALDADGTFRVTLTDGRDVVSRRPPPEAAQRLTA